MNYFGALRAFWKRGRPSENLGALLRETKNPRPSGIPESSGEQFPLYMVARGGAALLRPGKGGLYVKKVARAISAPPRLTGPREPISSWDTTESKPDAGQTARVAIGPIAYALLVVSKTIYRNPTVVESATSEFVCHFRAGSQDAARLSLETGQIPSTKRCSYRLRGKLRLRK